MRPRGRTSRPSVLAPLSWLYVPYGHLMAGGLLSALLFGAIVRVTGLGVSLVRLRRIVAHGSSVAGDQVLSILG